MPSETNPQRADASHSLNDGRRLAEAVRRACLEAALQAYEDAKMRGLCDEGAWETAVGALRTLDTEQVVNQTIQHPQSKT